MSGIAVAIGGAAVIGAVASHNASQTQSHAADNATNAQLAMFEAQQANQQPWLDAGKKSLGQLQDQMPELTRQFGMGDFTADPGYQFRMDQGNQAIERSAAARGGLNSGATLKALTQFSQGTASDEYQNAYNRFTNNQSNSYNRLASLAGVGQVANAQLGQQSMNASNNIGANMIGAGNAQAAGQIGTANAITGGIGMGLNTWNQQQMMNRMYPQTPGGGGGVPYQGSYSSGGGEAWAGMGGGSGGTPGGGLDLNGTTSFHKLE